MAKEINADKYTTIPLCFYLRSFALFAFIRVSLLISGAAFIHDLYSK